MKTSEKERELSIGEVAVASELRTSALRFYEEQRLISPTRRVSGRRRYDPAVLDRLRIIQLAQKAGFSLVEIRSLLRGIDADRISDSWKRLAQAKLEALDADMKRLRGMQRMLRVALECDCIDVVACSRALGRA